MKRYSTVKMKMFDETGRKYKPKHRQNENENETQEHENA